MSSCAFPLNDARNFLFLSLFFQKKNLGEKKIEEASLSARCLLLSKQPVTTRRETESREP